MTVTINDATMTSDQTTHVARLVQGSQHLWEVSWLPGRALDRNSAITAMTLADLAGQDSPGGRLACSVDEAARLTGRSRDLLYDEMRRGNLAYVKVGR